MKKRSTLITFILSILIIIVGYLAYIKYIRPTYLFNPTQTKEVVLGETNLITLIKHTDQQDIFGIEIEVNGNSSGIFDMMVFNETGLVHTIALKGEEVDYIYKNDWYSDTCFLKFIERDNANGELSVEYRFLGLN